MYFVGLSNSKKFVIPFISSLKTVFQIFNPSNFISQGKNEKIIYPHNIIKLAFNNKLV
jgi:hypothetical protein